MDYIKINKENWNKRCENHFSSDFYNNNEFINGKSSLNQIELEMLGDIRNKKIIHLQCHFGQDSISLERMGANVIGIDLSDKSIEKAKELNNLCKTNVEFVCCDVYDTLKYVNSKFDIVFTSYGTIGWLPDLDRWAKVINGLLNKNGKLIFVEFHPFIWMYDNELNNIQYSYFNKELIYEKYEGSYADKSNVIYESVGWNHPLSEVFQSLKSNGLEINNFNEFNYSPYRIFNDMKEIEDNKYIISKFSDKIPLVYSIEAVKL